MPRFKKEKFFADNSAGSTINLDVVINISAEGEFYANLPDYLRDAFSDRQTTRSGRASNDAKSVFKVVAKTYADLKQQIETGLNKHLRPDVSETPVIRYNIESHVSFAEDEMGNIFPNAGFEGARWNHEHRTRYGDHHATNPARGGYSLTIGARAMLKRVIRHGTNERVEYENFYKGGSHLEHENPAQLLNSWSAIDQSKLTREIPYSDKAALFFHSLLLGMATLNRQIQTATFDESAMLALIERQSGMGLLGLANPQPAEHNMGSTSGVDAVQEAHEQAPKDGPSSR